MKDSKSIMEKLFPKEAFDFECERIESEDAAITLPKKRCLERLLLVSINEARDRITKDVKEIYSGDSTEEKEGHVRVVVEDALHDLWWTAALYNRVFGEGRFDSLVEDMEDSLLEDQD